MVRTFLEKATPAFTVLATVLYSTACINKKTQGLDCDMCVCVSNLEDKLRESVHFFHCVRLNN